MWKPNQIPSKRVPINFMIKMSMPKEQILCQCWLWTDLSSLGNIKPMLWDCKASWRIIGGNSFPILCSLLYTNLRGFGEQLKEQHRSGYQTPPLGGWLEQRGRVKVFLRYFLWSMKIKSPFRLLRRALTGSLEFTFLNSATRLVFFWSLKIIFFNYKVKYTCKN